MTSQVEVPPLTGLIHFFSSSPRVKILQWLALMGLKEIQQDESSGIPL